MSCMIIMPLNKKTKLKRLLLILLLVLAVIVLFYLITRRVYLVEMELPRYCLYDDSEYAKFRVVVKDKAVIQTVKCNSIISERESLKIAYRSKVYWGYTGQEPFKSTYGHGDAPHAKTFPINPNAIVSNFYMHGKDFPIYITIFNRAGEIISAEYYSPKEKKWFNRLHRKSS